MLDALNSVDERMVINIFYGNSGGRVRHRGFHTLCVAVTICAGLASRSELLALPVFVAKYAGDALWGLMIFLLLAVLLPGRTTLTVVLLAAMVCCAVEFSQLYHVPWLDALRQTWLGRMTLGNVFAWGDMAAYLAGIGTGGGTEWVARLAYRRAVTNESPSTS